MPNKKNLLIYAHYYIPDTASTGQILRELAEGMLDKFNITVICVVPSYLGTIEDKYKTQKYYEEEINGVKVLRTRVPEFSKTNKKSRVKNIVSYFFGAMGATFKVGKMDYVFSISQPPILGGKDCFPKYTKQFLNHYYGMNEFFRGESQMKKKDEIKVCLVGSSGGHLTHLYMLKPFWKDKNRFWVTFDKEDARSLLEGEKVYPCYFPTNRSIKALIKNTKIAWDVLHKEKPDLIISCGAAVAVPFFYIGKMMGAKLVYIEVFDRIDKPTMTGKMVYPIVDKFVVQWEEQKKVYPKAVNLGSIF